MYHVVRYGSDMRIGRTMDDGNIKIVAILVDRDLSLANDMVDALNSSLGVKELYPEVSRSDDSEPGEENASDTLGVDMETATTIRRGYDYDPGT